MYIVYPLAKFIWMISLCFCSWCYVWFEMRCRYAVSAPLIMILIDLDVPPVFIHIQSDVRMDPCDLLSCVDVETMFIYIDIPAVASLRRTILCWFIVSICWHFLFSSFVCCFPIQIFSTCPGGGYSLYITSSNHQWISMLYILITRDQ